MTALAIMGIIALAELGAVTLFFILIAVGAILIGGTP